MALGTPTLTATTDPLGFVELVVTCTGATTVTIQRTYIGGSTTVRGAKDADITSGTFYVGDWEVPQADSYTYVATVSDGDSFTSTDPVTVDGIDRGGDYVAALTAPFNGTLIAVESFTENRLAPQADTATILGRPDPVTVHFGRSWLAGELVLISLTDEERRDLQSIVDSCGLLLFAPRKNVGIDDVLFFSVGDVTIERVALNAYEPARRWRLAVQRVAAPPASFTIPLGTTWQERVDEGDTWSYWSAAGTFFDLAGLG